MEYRRYALASYGLVKWVRCNQCSTPEEPVYVWEGREETVNFHIVVGAVMHHEITKHAPKPKGR